MIRSVLLWASTNPWMKRRVPRMAAVRRAVRRFMPGERLEDALEAAERQRDRGASTILTLLGENVLTTMEAQEVADHYRQALAEVARRNLDAEISVKLTQLGLDQSQEAALGHVLDLAKASAEASGHLDRGPLRLWIDMESSAYRKRTLDVYRAARAEHENVGLALQAYLHATSSDLESLLPLVPTVRLVKGAYLEPATVAMASKRAVDAEYHRLARRLLRERVAGKVGVPSIATHDQRIIGDVTRMARELELAKEAYEFGMLYGIGTADQSRLLSHGYRVRVLISYGEGWFPWFMRRLAERPANLWFVMKQLAG